MNNLMKTILCALVSLLFIVTGYAQQTAPICGHELLMNNMEEQYPGYRDAVNETFEAAKARGANSRAAGGNDVYTIPVVVHVVWNQPEENLPDSVILSQMEVLNEDFRRLNADTTNTRAEFASVVTDPMIEFDLQQIVRVQTTTTFEVGLLGGLPDAAIKTTAGGGSDGWDVNCYLNIWVVHMTSALGSILGYAYPPDGLPNWPAGSAAPQSEFEGVVIEYSAMGRNNPNDPPVAGFDIVGRTPTHEIGHYLGLRHIWGDGTGAIFGVPDCDVDDGVSDTPNSGTNSQIEGCDFSKNTCTEGSPDLPDMVENYMDYSTEVCQNSFTQGQVDIMRGVLEGPRNGLLTGNCMPINIEDIAHEKGLTVYPNPTQGLLNIEAIEAPVSIEVFDMLGKQVSLLEDNDILNQLNLSEMSTGIYLLRVTFEAGATKFIFLSDFASLRELLLPTFKIP